MPVSFNITINDQQLAALKLVTAGVKDGAPRALSQAINKTLTGAQTDMVQQVYDTYNLTKTRIREDFKVWNTNYKTLYGYVRAFGTSIKFAADKGGTYYFSSAEISTGGVRAKIKRNSAWEIWPKAFKATMPKSGHVGFFKRKDRAAHATSRTVYHGIPAQRLPWKRWYPLPEFKNRRLTELTGPAIESAFSTRQYPTAMPTVENKVKQRLDDNIGYQVDYELSKF